MKTHLHSRTACLGSPEYDVLAAYYAEVAKEINRNFSALDFTGMDLQFRYKIFMSQ